MIANNKSNIPEHDLKDIKRVIRYNYFLIIKEWKEYFKGQELKFYC